MPDIVLEMRHITKNFSGIQALDDVNFVVKRGEIHAICGENGAGKSTLMNILSGTIPYGSYSGDIIIDGEHCRFHNIKDSENKGIVIVHQELALIPYLSIAENIFIGNEQTLVKGVIDWNLTRQHANEILKIIGLENENLEVPINTLGVGKQQLVEIAKALAKKAKILILDEPTAALNDEESNRLLDLLVSLNAGGLTILLISHKIHELERTGHSITIFRDGKTIETIEKMNEPFDENRIIRSMVGRTLSNRFPSRTPRIGEVVLEVKNWNVYHPDYKNRKVINNVSLNLRRGEVVGIAGLMGAGRTELAMSIFGRTYGQKISGTVIKNGKKIELKNVKQAIRQGIAYLTEDRKLYGLILIGDVRMNITLASLKQFAKRNVVDDNNEVTAAEQMREKMNIKASSLQQRVSNLSGGNQQKVVLSKWILAAPDILILDEPTRGIDVGAKYELYTIINRLVSEGKSLLLISSDMSELLGLADRVYVLCEGEIAGEINREDLTQERIMKMIIAHSGRNLI